MARALSSLQDVIRARLAGHVSKSGSAAWQLRCACAWQYDTTNLKRLFYFWRPRNGEKHTTIAFLAHHAWTTSRGKLMDAGDPDAGWLRAHRIVSKTRFTQMQAWSTPSKFRQCPLRRGARRDAWPS